MSRSGHWPPAFSSFWALQGLGWAAYGVLWYLASIPVYREAGASLLDGALRTGYLIALGVGLTAAFRPFYRRLWTRGVSLGGLLLASALCATGGSALWLFLFEGMKWPLEAAPFSGAYGAGSLWYFARPLVSNAIVLLAWSALYFGMKYQRDLLAQQRRTLRAETLAREAQLEALRYQLNPHFLFNALHTLRTLVGDKAPRAAQFVEELAEILRYSLLDSSEQTVSLGEELGVVRSVLSIEKLRYEDDLEVEVDVEPEAESAQVPPLLVQTLVENAVKHGRQIGPSPLLIRLRAWREGDTLHVEVRNTGRLEPARSQGERAGLGLQNLRERLEQLYPEEGRFALGEEDGWVRARVAIPARVG